MPWFGEPVAGRDLRGRRLVLFLRFVPPAVLLGTVIAFGSLPAAARQAEAPVTRTVKLRHVKPSRVAPRLGAMKEPPGVAAPPTGRLPADLPPGVVAMGASDREMTLTLRGPAGQVKRTERLIGMLDVPPRPVTLRVRLLRIPLTEGEDDTAALTGDLPRNTVVVAKEALRTSSMEEAKATLVEPRNGDTWEVHMTPKANGDASVNLAYTVSRMRRRLMSGPEAPRLQQNAVSGALRLRAGSSSRLQTFDSSPEDGTDGVRSRYVVEVTPTLPSRGAGRTAPGTDGAPRR